MSNDTVKDTVITGKTQRCFDARMLKELLVVLVCSKDAETRTMLQVSCARRLDSIQNQVIVAPGRVASVANKTRFLARRKTTMGGWQMSKHMTEDEIRYQSTIS